MSGVSKRWFVIAGALQFVWASTSFYTGTEALFVALLVISAALSILTGVWRPIAIRSRVVRWWHVGGICCLYWPIPMWGVIGDTVGTDQLAVVLAAAATFVVFWVTGLDIIRGGGQIVELDHPASTGGE